MHREVFVTVQPSASCYRRHPHLNKAYSEVGVANDLFTPSSMTNQQGDWAWGELLQVFSFYSLDSEEIILLHHCFSQHKRKEWGTDD